MSVPDAALPIGSCYALGVVERRSYLRNQMHQVALMSITSSDHLGVFKQATYGHQIIHSLQHLQPEKRKQLHSIIQLPK